MFGIYTSTTLPLFSNIKYQFYVHCIWTGNSIETHLHGLLFSGLLSVHCTEHVWTSLVVKPPIIITGELKPKQIIEIPIFITLM